MAIRRLSEERERRAGSFEPDTVAAEDAGRTFLVPDASRAAEGLTVEPTPDDGTRLTTEVPWDETSRPTHTDSSGRTHAEPDNAAPQHLVDIHNGLRSELARLRDVLDRVRFGHATVGQARSVINTMTMRQNSWTLGVVCESYRRILTGHHTLEDRSIIPLARRGFY